MADDFVNNPIVSAVGSALGLDPLMAAGGGGVTTPPPAPVMKPGRSNAQTPREFRHSAPAPKAGGRGLQPGVGGGMNLPGVMSPEVLMHPAVQKLLGQYGVSPEQAASAATNASPNLFVTNPAAFDKHPIMANLLERGLEGAAFTHGGATPGESISNVAQGLLTAQQARSDKYNNQLMMPFAQASQVAGLQTTADDQRYKQAQAARDQALVEHYGNMDDTKQLLAESQAERNHLWGKMQNLTQNLHLNQMMQKTPFNAEEQGEYQKMVQAAGGDEFAVDPASFSQLLSKASQRKVEEDRTAAETRARIAGNSRISSASINSENRGNNPANIQLKAAYDAANKRWQDSDRALRTNMFTTDENGKRVMAGSSAAASYLKKLQDDVSTAQAAWKAGTNSSQPSKAPTAHKRAYNPLTGRIE